MKQYNPKDNDTYQELYSFSMSQDVEIHMFMDPRANTVLTALGNKKITGNFSEESKIVARNNVLHFPTASALELKLLKYKELPSLVPLSLMKRYQRSLKDCTYTQKNPIFFDVEKEQFVRVLDYRFLRDLSQESKQSFVAKLEGDLSIKVSAEHVSLYYEDLNDLYSDTTKIYHKVYQAYLEQLINIYPTQDVIILAYDIEQDKNPYLRPDNQFISHMVMRENIFKNACVDFEFIKAKKIADNHYCPYKGPVLEVSKFLHFDKNKKDANSISGMFLGEKNSLLVLPYDENSWSILSKIKEEIDEIFQNLSLTLLRQKSANLLDCPISDIKTEFLKIENKRLKP